MERARAERRRSTAQQSPREHRLQLAAAVDDQVDDDLAIQDPIDHPAGLERGLAGVLDDQRGEYLQVAAAFRNAASCCTTFISSSSTCSAFAALSNSAM